MKKIKIGISEGTKYFHYENWFSSETNVEIIKLGYQLDNFNDVEKCDGIVLSGGHDVNPRLYRQPDFLVYVDPDNMDERRDEFEWNIIKYTQEKQKPLLGICRGLQLVNVYFGGSLVPDIPAFGKFNHGKLKEGNDRHHFIDIDPNSNLYKMIGDGRGEVNSAHHQSVDMPGMGLVVNALSPDGIIEGMERKTVDGSAFLMLVQWHPERMHNQQSNFAKNVKKGFLEAVASTV